MPEGITININNSGDNRNANGRNFSLSDIKDILDDKYKDVEEKVSEIERYYNIKRDPYLHERLSIIVTSYKSFTKAYNDFNNWYIANK